MLNEPPTRTKTQKLVITISVVTLGMLAWTLLQVLQVSPESSSTPLPTQGQGIIDSPATLPATPSDTDRTTPASPVRAGTITVEALTVRVTAGGRAIPGARVYLIPTEPSLTSPFLAGEPPNAVLEGQVPSQTDALGIVTLELAGPSLVLCSAIGYASAATIARTGDREVEVSLETGHSLRCVVKAIKGELDSEPWMRAGPVIRRVTRNGMELPLDPHLLATWLLPPKVTRNVDGSFQITALPSGLVRIEAGAKGFTTDAGDVRIPWRKLGDTSYFFLYREAAVTGTVVDRNGVPVHGAQVDPYIQDYQAGFAWREGTLTDTSGRFSVPSMPTALDGSGLLISTDGRGSARVSLPSLRPGDVHDVHVVLEAPLMLRGSIRTSTGEPIRGVAITVLPQDSMRPVARGQTDLSGDFACDVSHPGVVHIDARRAGYGDETAVATLPREDQVEITMIAEGSVRGVVRVDGEPASSGTVHLVLEDDQGRVPLFIQTDIDPGSGWFVFGGIEPGNIAYTLVANVSGAGMVQRRDVVVDAATSGRSFDLDILRADGRAISGLVEDAATGAPIVGAEVTLMYARGTAYPQAHAALPASTTTDANGRYLLAGVPISIPVGVGVKLAPYAEQARVVTVDAGDAEVACDFDLHVGSTVRMWVEDFDGARMNHFDAYVEHGILSSRAAVSNGPVHLFEGLEPGDTLVSVGLHAHEKTEILGQTLKIRIDLKAGETVDVPFRLTEYPRIVGTIRGDIAQHRDFTAYIIDPRDSPWTASRTIRNTDEFTLLCPAPGDYEILLEASDGKSDLRAAKSISLAARQELALDFEFPSTGVQGTVLDGRGEPVAGTILELNKQTDSYSGRTFIGSFYARPDPNGRYESLGMAPGIYEYYVYAPGYGAEMGDVEVLEGEETAKLDITLHVEAAIRVAVTDRSGQPVTKPALLVLPDVVPGVGLRPSRVDTDGRYVRARLAPGTYVVQAEAAGFFPARKPCECTSGEDTLVDLRLRRLADLRVRLRDALGRPLANQPFQIVDKETGDDASQWIRDGWFTSPFGTLTSGDDGESLLQGLPVGEFAVTACGQSRTVQLEVSNEATELTIQEVR